MKMRLYKTAGLCILLALLPVSSFSDELDDFDYVYKLAVEKYNRIISGKEDSTLEKEKDEKNPQEKEVPPEDLSVPAKNKIQKKTPKKKSSK